MDGNPEIAVERTGDEELHCFRLRLGTSSFLLHTRDLADLHHKAGLELLDWIAETTESVIEAELRTLGRSS